MADRTQYLLELVKRNVKAYTANPKTKAVMVTGSVAEGLCDEYSDCDVMLYYDELPSEAELQLARQQNQGSELIEMLGDRQEGAFGETLLINGVECQFAHATIAHQGGIATTAQALRAGRPTLIVPYSHDQPDNAARVQRLGTSRTIPREQYSASRIAKELSELLDNPSYAAKAIEIGRIIQAENGVGVACDAIEEQLREVAIVS
jgi:predicted nucleotidyltransferase